MQSLEPEGFGLSRPKKERPDPKDLILAELIKKLLAQLKASPDEYSTRVVQNSTKILTAINELVNSIDPLTRLKILLYMPDINILVILDPEGNAYLMIKFNLGEISNTIKSLVESINLGYASKTESHLLKELEDGQSISIVLLKF